MGAIIFSTGITHCRVYTARVLAFAILAFLSRVMGPTEVGEFTTLDFIVAITIGSIASAALVDSQVHFFKYFKYGIMGIFVGVVKSARYKVPNIRRIIVGGPLVLVRNGKLLEKNLFRAKMNFDDLMSALRIKDAPLLEDVEFAVLEPKGRNQRN